MKTHKQPVKYVKNDLITAKPSEPKIKDHTGDLARNSQSLRALTQERPPLRSFRQQKQSAPPLFSDPNDQGKGSLARSQWDMPRFEKGSLTEERRRREMALKQAACEKNKKFNFSANSKLNQRNDAIADQARPAHNLASLPRIKSTSRHLQPTPSIYSGDSCSTPSIKQ